MGILDEDFGILFTVKSLVVFIFATVFLLWRCRKRSVFPPGPTGLPFVGYLPFLGSTPQNVITELSKTYGPLFSLNIGGENFIILSSYDVVYEALVKRGSVFSGRQRIKIFESGGAHNGIVFGDYGPKWKASRKFGINTLKGFGVGKRSMEERVTEEIRYLSDIIASKQGENIDIHHDLGNAVANIVCSIVTGQRFNYDDEAFKELLSFLKKRFNDPAITGHIKEMTFVPSLRYLPSYGRAYKVFQEFVNYITTMFDRIIEDHEDKLDKSDIRDVIDAYLAEIGKDSSEDALTRDRLNIFIRDLFTAGTETITTTLRWCLLYLAKNPSIQDKLAEEIKRISGTDGVISMANRVHMPLTCSFIHEVQRHRSIIPLVIHKVTEDVQFRGYALPKNTLVIANLWGVHNDPDTFESPHDFIPERFLNKDGKFFKHEKVIPYSVGPRYCLGIHLADMELFMFLTGIIRNFRIETDQSNPLPSFHEGATGLVYSPFQFKISFHLR